MSGPTVTCACSHCRELCDVFIGFREPDLPFEIGREDCPVCEQVGGLSVWDETLRPCPACQSGTMVYDPNGNTMLSD